MTNKNIAEVVELEPKEEIYFKGPFDVDSFSSLHLTNLSKQFLVFKIKTTAPQMYTVRPTHGSITSLGTSLVSIMLQASDPGSFVKNRHKFLVQVAYGPETEDGQIPENFNPEEYWKNLGNNAKSTGQIYERKLKCAFNVMNGSLQTTATGQDSHKSNSSRKGPAMRMTTPPNDPIGAFNHYARTTGPLPSTRTRPNSPTYSMSTTFSQLTNGTSLLESAQSLRDPQNVYVIYGLVLLVLLVALLLGGGSVDESIKNVHYNRRG